MRYLNLIKNLNNWLLFFAVKLGMTKRDPLLFITRKGILVQVPRRLIHTFKEIFMEECYMHGLGFDVPDRSVIIDIGANAGFYSLFACSRFSHSKIFAFEPILSNFKLLEINQNLNRHLQITSIQKAVAGHSGEVTMMLKDYNDGFSTSAHIVEGDQVQDRCQVVKVPCVTIQDIFDEYKLEKCDLLKMDCEGAEHDIIYNCPPEYLSRIKQIAMELHSGIDPKHDTEHMKEYLLSQGFATRQSKKALGMLWASKIT